MSKDIETLISKNNYSSSDRWYPISVDSFRSGFLPLNSSIEGYHPLVDNLAYSLQYLQFIEKELDELNLSQVIYIMLVKSYVITGMGIIEGVFTNLLKSNGLWKKNDEEIVLTSKTEQSKDNDTYRIKTEVVKKVDPKDATMTLDEMIKCLDHHHAILTVDHLVYPALTRLRNLRNRVHLQKGETNNDHDYNAFDSNVKIQMQSILYDILCSEKITDPRSIHNYDFLKPEVK